jgi:hypothetical protein
MHLPEPLGLRGQSGGGGQAPAILGDCRGCIADVVA